MKSAVGLLTLLSLALFAMAETPPVVNFNLVQVNRYDKSDAAPQSDSVVAPKGSRLVIDMQNSGSVVKFFGKVSINNDHPKKAEDVAPHDLSGAQPIPWDSTMMVRSLSGQDSFLVRSSQTGCPGTEVRPSVSVAFPAGQGWSDPPIRFGPLCDRTFCPLGEGYQLEVIRRGNDVPLVRLIEPDAYSRRK
jgi:hypothetical protein